MALSYLTGSVTQGSADAFAEAEVATALSGQSGLAFRVRELLFEVNPLTLTGAADVLELALCRRSKTAMPNVTDRDVIAKIAWGLSITTSGAALESGVFRLTYSEDDDLIVVEDPLYFDFDSASTALTGTAYVRIGYTVEKISAVDRLTLLTQSLES